VQYTHELVIPSWGECATFGEPVTLPGRSCTRYESAEEANAALAAYAGKHGLRYRLHLGEWTAESRSTAYGDHGDSYSDPVYDVRAWVQTL
jgi:hypothetical protein